MSDHAILPPSSASEWGNCYGWLRMHADLPSEQETDAARWGNECHALAAQMVEAHSRAGHGMPERGGVDDEMWETAELYALHCKHLMQTDSVFGGPQLGIESRLAMPTVHAQVWGTADFYLHAARVSTLVIRDLKTGYLLVEPDDEQLLLYAWGVIEKLQLNVAELQVDLGVVQPRGFHRKGPIRTAAMRATDLKHRVMKLREAATANVDGTGALTAGEHCRNCRARARCPAAQQLGPALLQLSTQALPSEPTPTEAGQLLRWTRRALKHLEQMEKAYAGEVEGHVRAGVVVPGWAMEPTYARSKEWTRPEPDVRLLGQMFGADLSKPGLVTPTQAEKKGIPAEIINGYCTRPQTGVKLTEVSDDTIANIFGAK